MIEKTIAFGFFASVLQCFISMKSNIIFSLYEWLINKIRAPYHNKLLSLWSISGFLAAPVRRLSLLTRPRPDNWHNSNIIKDRVYKCWESEITMEEREHHISWKMIFHIGDGYLHRKRIIRVSYICEGLWRITFLQ